MALPPLHLTGVGLADDWIGDKNACLTELRDSLGDSGVMLACWDLGGIATQECRLVQSAAGITSGRVDDEFVESLQLAMTEPGVRHLIVCGHLRCPTLDRVLEELRLGREVSLVRGLTDVAQRVVASYSGRSFDDQRALVVQELVCEQLGRLASRASIAGRLESGDVKLHGWVIDDKAYAYTALDRLDRVSIYAFDPRTAQFR